MFDAVTLSSSSSSSSLSAGGRNRRSSGLSESDPNIIFYVFHLHHLHHLAMMMMMIRIATSHIIEIPLLFSAATLSLRTVDPTPVESAILGMILSFYHDHHDHLDHQDHHNHHDNHHDNHQLPYYK